MNKKHLGLVFAALIIAASPVWAMAEPITEQQAVEMALAKHPGVVQKAYREIKKGVDVWEVMIEGNDGYTWKLYYKVADGELFKEKRK